LYFYYGLDDIPDNSYQGPAIHKSTEVFVPSPKHIVRI
jgi:hypothetical protein